jgi:uncharacterized protein
MLLELGKIITQPGGVVPFSLEMDFSQLDFGGSCPAAEPVQVTGQVRNEAGVLMLTATLDTTLHCVCDRCATPFLRPFHEDLEAILVTELAHEENEDDWTFLLKGDCADLEEIVNTAFVLNMESKFLCSPDCKGLCAVCGKNLNDGPCDCKPEPDPRLAVLGQLLKDKP